MSKGNRKRATQKQLGSKNKKPIAIEKSDAVKMPAYDTIFKQFPIKVMTTTDSNRVKEIFGLSNTVAALQKKYADTLLQIKFSKKFIEQLKSGDVKGPLMVRVSPTLFMPLTDMEKAVKSIRTEISMLEETNKLTKGQLEHRYEEYVDSLIRYNRILTQLIGDKHVTTLTTHRPATKESQKDEEIIFEKEFNDEVKNESLESLQDQVNDAIAKDKAKKVNGSSIEKLAEELKKKE